MTDFQARPSSFPWPPVIFVGAVAASVLLHVLVELPWLSSPMSDILFAFGWILVGSAVALTISALRAMRAAKTTLAPHHPAAHLVTNGAFKITRNPLYLANTCLLLGVGLIGGMPWFLILAIIAAFLTQKLAIEPEERHLAARFGKKYRDYAKQVRRWV